MAAKKCLKAGIGDHPKSCACSMSCCSVTVERNAQIALDARSGHNWAEEKGDGPGCICGAGTRTLLAATAFKGVHGQPAGRCAVHPGGTVHRQGE